VRPGREEGFGRPGPADADDGVDRLHLRLAAADLEFTLRVGLVAVSEWRPAVGVRGRRVLEIVGVDQIEQGVDR